MFEIDLKILVNLISCRVNSSSGKEFPPAFPVFYTHLTAFGLSIFTELKLTNPKACRFRTLAIN